MNKIQATLRLSGGGELLELRGCESAHEAGGRPTSTRQSGNSVKQYPSGTLTLQFGAGSEGLKELERRIAIDEGTALTGTMTVVDEHGVTTQYECGFERLQGNAVSFMFACIK